MNKFKKIIDIIVIGLAIAVVVVLGDRIIKIGNDAQEGRYPGYEQESSSEIVGDKEMIPGGNNAEVAINLVMEIDRSLFKEKKDLHIAASLDKKENIIEGPEETSDGVQQVSSETAETENNENNPEDTESPDNDNLAQEVAEENSIDLEDNTSIIENIDYSDSADFRIEVDLPRQRLIVFYSDEVLKEFICSGGTPGDDTPPGEYTTIEKIEYSWVDRYNVGAYYWVRFYGNYLIHSVPFDENGEMIVEEFEKLGQPASHGCIRLRLEEAKWLYETLPLGVKVVIY
jgi:lipoprotein-anchoring transpeptidase ErfK/SrfK